MLSRVNNFDFLRLVFASFVILTHSYPLSGQGEADFLQQITANQISFSWLGVKRFFIISGFLIFKSMLRAENLSDYFWKRLLRLFPALLVVLFLTIILAPSVYDSHVPYLHNAAVYSYIPQNLSLYFFQYNIPGVFENNPYKGAINGSLWTICYEFSMYVMVALLFVFRKSRFLKYLVAAMFVASIILLKFFPGFFNGLVFNRIALDSRHFYELMAYFVGGMLMTYVNFKNLKLKNAVLFAVTLLIVLSLILKIFSVTGFLLLPIAVILFGTSSTKMINKIGEKFGDTSYGIYIYGFPVQQTLMHFFKMDLLPLMFFSLTVSIILGWLSWHFIEKKALLQKDFVRNLRLPL